MTQPYRPLIVGGSFDHDSGKPSKIVEALAVSTGWPVINGGNLSIIQSINFRDYDVLVWMPNVDNSEEKILPTIKTINPHLTLISSKRIIEKSYTPFDVIGRLLKTKSNLGIVVEQVDGRYNFKLLDPLGNQYCNTAHAEELGVALLDRVNTIRSLTRISSKTLGALQTPFAEPDPEFISVIRDLGDEFSRHVNAANPERFLGNVSARATDRITRCCHGFPAFRDAGHYLVSRRNVNKATFGADDFVVVSPDLDQVRYFGEVKPSVDAPIQIRLFEHYPHVNYIVHGHVYIDNAPITRSKIPCGHIEEFGEITDLFPQDSTNFGVNLRGHGCLIMAEDIVYLRSQKDRLTSRPFPEP